MADRAQDVCFVRVSIVFNVMVVIVLVFNDMVNHIHIIIVYEMFNMFILENDIVSAKVAGVTIRNGPNQ